MKVKKKGKKKRKKVKNWTKTDFVREVWKVMKRQEELSPAIKELHRKLGKT